MTRKKKGDNKPNGKENQKETNENSNQSQKEPGLMSVTSDILKNTREAMFNQQVNCLADNSNTQVPQVPQVSQNTSAMHTTMPLQRGHQQGQFTSPQAAVNNYQNVTGVGYPSSAPAENAYQGVQFNTIQQPMVHPGNGMPQWAASMCQQLNNIQCTLEHQNRRWQSIEDKLQTQNTRMGNIESQLANLPVLEQSLSQANRNIEHTQREVHSMKQKVTEYDNTIQQYSNMCDDLISNNSRIGQKINEVSTQLKNIEQNQSQMQKCQAEAQERIVDLQWRSMRENLVFSGILETGREENCEALVSDFIKTKLEIQDEIGFDRVHRLGRFIPNQRYPRPIVAKFTNFKDKEKVKSAAPNKLKNTNYYINDQYPQEIEQKRKMLYPVAREARQNPNNKVKLVKDKLYINGKQYSSSGMTDTSGGQTRQANTEHIIPNRNIEQNTRRRYTRRNENTDCGASFVKNRFSVFESDSVDVTGTPKPVVSGKKKAVSPLDSDIASKKIRDTTSDDGNNSVNSEILIDLEETQSPDIPQTNTDNSPTGSQRSNDLTDPVIATVPGGASE